MFARSGTWALSSSRPCNRGRMSRLRGFNTYMEYERGFHGWLVFFFITMCIGELFRAYTLVQLLLAAVTLRGNGAGMAATLPASVAAGLVGAMWIGGLYGLYLFVHAD